MSEIEPRVGWRIWRVRDGGLRSLRVNYLWQAGVNHAECFKEPLAACTESPGKLCRCGFWALNTPSACAFMAFEAPHLHPLAMGLVAGWGQVAVHGREGFRSERARLLCLFEDVIAEPFAPPRSRIGQWLHSMFWSAPLVRRLKPSPPDPDGLSKVATDYGVPLMALAESARCGVLAEFGVKPDVIDEIDRWDYTAARQVRA